MPRPSAEPSSIRGFPCDRGGNWLRKAIQIEERLREQSMSFNARINSPPKYWQEFENLCLAIFTRVWVTSRPRKMVAAASNSTVRIFPESHTIRRAFTVFNVKTKTQFWDRRLRKKSSTPRSRKQKISNRPSNIGCSSPQRRRTPRWRRCARTVKRTAARGEVRGQNSLLGGPAINHGLLPRGHRGILSRSIAAHAPPHGAT